jgi:hypothetical protein
MVRWTHEREERVMDIERALLATYRSGEIVEVIEAVEATP